jgi:hypothetical protein
MVSDQSPYALIFSNSQLVIKLSFYLNNGVISHTFQQDLPADFIFQMSRTELADATIPLRPTGHPPRILYHHAIARDRLFFSMHFDAKDPLPQGCPAPVLGRTIGRSLMTNFWHKSCIP